MSNQSRNDLINKFNDVVNLKAKISVVEHLGNKIYKFNTVPSMYDVNHILNAFHSYKSGKIDKEYFEKWCAFYAGYLDVCMCITASRDIAYRQISWVLDDEEMSLDEKLDQVIYHNDVLMGKIPVPYMLASNYEIFYTSVDEKASMHFWNKRKEIADFNECNDCGVDCNEDIECYECPKRTYHPDDLDEQRGSFLVLHVNHATKQYSAYQIDGIIPNEYFDAGQDMLCNTYTYQHLIYDAFMCYINAVHELGFEQVEVEKLYE